MPAKGSATEQQDLRDLQIREAEWVSEQLGHAIEVIHRYRILYITALFFTFGWLLGQLLNSNTAAPSDNDRLALLRVREDIGVVLCFVPLANSLLALQMMEANAHLHSLARYRVVVAAALAGAGEMPWRWEAWRESHEGSTLAWTTVLNILFALVLFILSGGALWFSWPALTETSNAFLVSIWWLALSVVGLMSASALILGLYYRYQKTSEAAQVKWDALSASEIRTPLLFRLARLPMSKWLKGAAHANLTADPQKSKSPTKPKSRGKQ